MTFETRSTPFWSPMEQTAAAIAVTATAAVPMATGSPSIALNAAPMPAVSSPSNLPAAIRQK